MASTSRRSRQGTALKNPFDRDVGFNPLYVARLGRIPSMQEIVDRFWVKWHPLYDEWLAHPVAFTVPEPPSILAVAAFLQLSKFHDPDSDPVAPSLWAVARFMEDRRRDVIGADPDLFVLYMWLHGMYLTHAWYLAHPLAWQHQKMPALLIKTMGDSPEKALKRGIDKLSRDPVYLVWSLNRDLKAVRRASEDKGKDFFTIIEEMAALERGDKKVTKHKMREIMQQGRRAECGTSADLLVSTVKALPQRFAERTTPPGHAIRRGPYANDAIPGCEWHHEWLEKAFDLEKSHAKHVLGL